MPLYLLGFMGAGKTTVGKILATKLKRQFIDLDDCIEQAINLRIPEIFENYGEKYFRELETQCLQKISSMTQLIVATGGGIVLSPQNQIILKQSGISFYLKWSASILYRRIKMSTHRPLLQGIDQLKLSEQIENMLIERTPFYEQANYIIDSDEQTTPDQTVALIIQKLSNK